MPDPKRWTSRGIKYLCHIYTPQGFKSFSQMRLDFDLPRTYLFYYYQLRHAVRAQFGSLDSPLRTPNLEKLLRSPDQTKLISTYYSGFVADTNPRLKTAQKKWDSLDVPITEEDWSEFCDTFKTSVISSRDRAIQIKIFHHSHLTPARMHKMGISSSAECFGDVAKQLHCFWTCPIVHDFWVNIGSFISSALGLPNIVNPKNCLLGIFGDLTIPSQAKRLLRILVFLCEEVPFTDMEGIRDPNSEFLVKTG